MNWFIDVFFNEKPFFLNENSATPSIWGLAWQLTIGRQSDQAEISDQFCTFALRFWCLAWQLTIKWILSASSVQMSIVMPGTTFYTMKFHFIKVEFHGLMFEIFPQLRLRRQLPCKGQQAGPGDGVGIGEQEIFQRCVADGIEKGFHRRGKLAWHGKAFGIHQREMWMRPMNYLKLFF